ncbi:ABC transporter ATP-binding protein [Sediminibacillus halophilus]|uniref:ABC-2 type transport system ATP-binding protein n=1 Tax=Sediminibacillus halophilus TaxID=482461 RepID=A0A1G9NG96_9BACI|nr:ABC transporter ATP-binding protein [Sediminibacillus halophilus]SDL85077.1 ABC-2 type transport system ATP-binding protein [Sediminibacillus halophilus]
METIRTENLTKNFQGVKAVDHVSLTVDQGDIYGFLGLNGAGKTTTIRMLLGMIRPTSGACYIKGRKIAANSHHVWHHVGYMVETPYAYPELTVKENLLLVQKIRGVKDSSTVPRIINRLQLNKYEHKKVRHLSMGNAQRLGIAKALLHEPEILVLDEPTNGLDPAGIVEIRQLIQDLAHQHGKTIFISSHILGEIARTATKIAIIDDGRLIQELKKEELDYHLSVTLKVKTRDVKYTERILSHAGYQVTDGKEGYLEIKNREAINHPDIVNSFLVNAGYPPTKLFVEEEDLEAYFLRITGREGVSDHEIIL